MHPDLSRTQSHRGGALRWVLTGALVALGWPALATAHIEVAPERVVAGALVELELTVPNERANADTTTVAVRLPAGFHDVRPAAPAGWSAVHTTGADTTIVTWTSNAGTAISGTASLTFRVTTRVPTGGGDAVALPTVQTYSNGEVDRWIESIDSERPAPQLLVADATTPPAPDAAPAPTAVPDGERSTGLIAAVVGAAALAMAGMALLMRNGRRRRGDHAAPTDVTDRDD